jgi:hypothetical protein
MMEAFTDVLVALSILGAMLAALELGFRFGRRSVKHHDAPASGQVGAIQGALLGLLGLLLGFSFAAAGARFLERQDLITSEANAIGTLYLRADLLAEPHRTALRSAVKDYTMDRLEISTRLRSGLAAEDVQRIELHHRRIWSAARDGTAASPTLGLLVIPAVNDVLDLHTTRVASGAKHLPMVVMALLATCSLLSIGVIGFGVGLGRSRRLPLTTPLAIVIAVALWVTVDLDHPRAGLLRLSDAPLRALAFDASAATGSPPPVAPPAGATPPGTR